MSDGPIKITIDPNSINSIKSTVKHLDEMAKKLGWNDQQLKTTKKSLDGFVQSLSKAKVSSPFTKIIKDTDSAREAFTALEEATKKTNAELAKLRSNDSAFLKETQNAKALLIVTNKLNAETEKQAALIAKMRERTGVDQGSINLRAAKAETAELEKQLKVQERSINSEKYRLKLLLEERAVEKGMADLRSKGIAAGASARAAAETKKLAAEEKAVAVAAKDAERAIRALDAATVKASATNSKFTQSNRLVKDSLRGVAGGAGKMSLGYGGISTIATVTASYAAVAGAVALFQNSLDFDYLVNYSAAISDSAVSVSRLKEEILAISGVTASPVALAEGFKELTRAGFDANEILDKGLLKTMAKFSTVSELPISDAIQLAVTQSKAFGESIENVADIVTNAVFSSPITFQDMAGSLKYTTELAEIAGLSFNDVATAIALVGEKGIKSTAAGTALRTGLEKMLTPTKELTKLFDSMGVNISDVFDEKGNVNMKQTIGLVKEVYYQLDRVSQVKVAKDWFGLRSQKDMIALLSSFDEWDAKLQKSKDSLGANDEALEKLSNSAKYNIDVFKATFSSAAIKEFQAEIEALGPRIKALVPYADEIGSAFVGLIEIIGVGLVAALVTIIPKMMTFTGLASANAIQIGVMSASMTTLTGTITTLSGVIFAMFAGFKIGTWLAENVEWVNTAAINTMKTIHKAFTLGIGGISDAFSTLFDLIKTGFLVVVDSLKTAWGDLILEMASTLKELTHVSIGGFEVGVNLDLVKGLEDTGDKLKAGTKTAEEHLQGFVERSIARTKATEDEWKASAKIYQEMLDDHKKHFADKRKVEEEAAKLTRSGVIGELAPTEDSPSGGVNYEQRMAELKAAEKAAEAMKKVTSDLDSMEFGISTKGMTEMEAAVASNTRELNQYISGLDKATLGQKNYDDAVARAKNVFRELLAQEKEAIGVKQDLVVASKLQSLQAKTDAQLLKAEGEELKGMAKLYNDIAKAKLSFVNSPEYKYLIDNNETEKAAKALEDFEAATYKAVMSVDNLIKARRESDNFFDGFAAGAMSAAKELTRLGEVGYAAFDAMKGGVKDSMATTLKWLTHGLSDAKDDIKDVLNDTTQAAEKTYNESLAELESSYADGIISTREYEESKTTILESYNQARLDAQTQ